MRGAPSAIVLGLVVALASVEGAGGVVLCQNGKRFVLRSESCLRKETRVPLDAETLDGKSAAEMLAPLEERVQALEALVNGMNPGTTTTTLPRPARVTCSCTDLTTQSECVAQLDCINNMSGVMQACATACAAHGELVQGGFSCDNEDSSCQ